mmetsp:Transcript_4943/g.19775  ORF Transcript_4943/g.19775 Transcript_4943/m.19775 type:complete len:222 (+) Transcript_4943:1577-2242(+)
MSSVLVMTHSSCGGGASDRLRSQSSITSSRFSCPSVWSTVLSSVSHSSLRTGNGAEASAPAAGPAPGAPDSERKRQNTKSSGASSSISVISASKVTCSSPNPLGLRSTLCVSVPSAFSSTEYSLATLPSDVSSSVSNVPKTAPSASASAGSQSCSSSSAGSTHCRGPEAAPALLRRVFSSVRNTVLRKSARFVSTSAGHSATSMTSACRERKWTTTRLGPS